MYSEPVSSAIKIGIVTFIRVIVKIKINNDSNVAGTQQI